eukprot:GHVU01114630.1.p1 GENE.GHVU01114630.1~~GHVU01114630.1.p1  ORF type:complete len:184 (-),score=20.64 GHVU01114630.1:1682-2233(-)
MGKAADFYLDQKTLKDIQRDLYKVFPKTGKQNTAIANGMKKSAAPLVTGLKGAISTQAKDTGKLKKSIKIFRSKRLDDNGRPSVFIGPKVNPPTKFKNKRGQNKQEMEQNAKDREQWAKKQSGYYFYFLEYGFEPFAKGKVKPGLGLLPQVASAFGNQVMNSLYNNIWLQIKKGADKQGLKIG